MKGSDARLVNNVNSIMSELGGLTDDLYEALMDHEKEDAVAATEKLIRLLRDIQKSNK